MKLVREHKIETDNFSLTIRPPWWKRIFHTNEWIKENTYEDQIPGRMHIISYPVIDFEMPVAIGMLIDQVVTDKFIYYNVQPASHVDGNPNIAECIFTHWRNNDGTN